MHVPAAMQALIDAALAVRAQAYVPYSKFRVGAALRLTDGRLVVGVNVENASYGHTLCAERTAVVTAVTQGLVPGQLAAAAVVSDAAAGAAAPCGACRQVLWEFAAPQLPIWLHNLHDGQTQMFALEQLLPHAFGPAQLGRA